MAGTLIPNEAFPSFLTVLCVSFTQRLILFLLSLLVYTVNTHYNAHFFNQNFTIKTGGAHYMWVYLYMCGYVEKYYIYGLNVGVRIIHGIYG